MVDDERTQKRLREVIACMSDAPQPWRADLQYLYGLVDRLCDELAQRDEAFESRTKDADAMYFQIDELKRQNALMLEALKELRDYARKCWRDKKPPMAWRIAEKTTDIIAQVKALESVESEADA